MRTRIPATVALAGLALALAGCVSLKRTPEARFFVLQSEIEPGASASTEEPAGIVGVEKVYLPGHLMRPQLVTWTAPNELSVDEFLRWAEPLEDGIARSLGEDLAALLPDHQIIRRPWPGATRFVCRVELVLQVFGLQRDGMVRLEGRWRLLPNEGQLALVQRPVRLERGPLAHGGEGSVVTGVDVMSQLIADLSRQIADGIRALPPEEIPVTVPEESVTSEEIEGQRR
jgi:uncharacterized lipoprotein YmbA